MLNKTGTMLLRQRAPQGTRNKKMWKNQNC